MTSPRTTATSPPRHGRRILAASLALGLTTMAAAPAAMAADQSMEPNPIGFTSMNWVDDSVNIYRLTNSSTQNVSGAVTMAGSDWSKDVDVPAKGALFFAVPGVRTAGQTLTFQMPGFKKPQAANPWLATGHVAIVVTAAQPLTGIPNDFKVTATSSIETIVWTWDGATFSAVETQVGDQKDHVFEAGKLDVPLSESYTITTSDLPTGVTVAKAKDPSLFASFDMTKKDDPTYVDAFGQAWWGKEGKYDENSVTVTGFTPETEGKPEEKPEEKPEGEQTEGEQTEGEGEQTEGEQPEGLPSTDKTEETDEVEAVVESEETEELAKTGGSLTAALLGAGLLAGGAGLITAKRRAEA